MIYRGDRVRVPVVGKTKIKGQTILPDSLVTRGLGLKGSGALA